MHALFGGSHTKIVRASIEEKNRRLLCLLDQLGGACPAHALASLSPSVLSRRRAKKKGVRPRDMPEEVAAKLGEANLLYASQE